MKQISSMARPSLLCISISLALASIAHAQQSTQQVEPVIVTGNPFGSNSAGRAESVLTGDALAERARASLGETLTNLPGVSSSYFGPGASRPIIRGFDGERIRVMENGAASIDAASLSPDHGVPIEPIALARIEVLRGPAALLYGSNAIGGVINAISSRLPRAATPFGGQIALGATSGDGGRSIAGQLGGGFSGMAFHVDASTRSHDSVRIPRTIIDDEARTRIVNSQLESRSGAVGLSKVWKGGFAGVSVDHYVSEYGVVAADDVTIDLRRTRTTAAFSQDMSGASVANVSGHAAWTRYGHDEVEGNGEIGSTFANRGLEWRFEAKSAKIGMWRWNVGISGETSRFTAQGEEAFVPPTRTQNIAAFGLAQALVGPTEWNFGARFERARVQSQEVFDDDGDSRFGPADSRRLTLVNGAASVTHSLSSGLALRAGASLTERAPTYFERYANGVHAATNAFEVGDANLGKERAQQLELGLNWTQGSAKFKANAFVANFKNFISLDATGEMRAAEAHHGEAGAEEGEAESVPEYKFNAVPARFSGFELEGTWRAMQGAQTLDLRGHLDVVRATNRASGEPLARIAPMRLGAGVTWARAGWRVSADALRAFKQTKVPTAQGETPTPGYTLISASVGYGLNVGGSTINLALRGSNLGNALAFNAASVQTIRERAPLPGRSIGLTAQMAL